MKKSLFIVTVALLLFNSLGAMYGGWSLIGDPTGGQLQLPLSFLRHTPFTDFLIPGIVLLFVNGILSMLVMMAIVFDLRRYSLLIVVEGGLLTGWIVIQYLWTQMYHPLQAVMGTVGLLLMSCGYLLFKEERHTSHLTLF